MGHLVSRLHGGPRLRARAVFWCAWSLWVLSVVTTAALFAYSAIHPLPTTIRGSPAEVVIAVAFIGGFATVGALLGWKRPANPIGWLMCGTALSYTAGDVGQLLFLRFARTQALGDWLGWAWLFGLGLVALVLLLFPTGALLSRRWRPVAWAAAAGLAGWVLGNAFAPVIFSADSRPANPFGIGGLAGKVFLVLAGGGAALVVLSGVAAIVSLVFRYRRARVAERAQLKWLVFAAGLIVVAVLASIGAPSQLQNAVASGAIAAVPVAIGVAIFRYHLYDIDLVINKTLVYGSLAAFITGVYVAIVVGIGALLQHGTRPSLGLSILATAVVAVAFQPVRERVQHLANHLVYGKRATPYEALSTFAGQLGATAASGLRRASVKFTTEFVQFALPLHELLRLDGNGVFLRPARCLTGREISLFHHNDPLAFGNFCALGDRGPGFSLSIDDVRLARIKFGNLGSEPLVGRLNLGQPLLRSRGIGNELQ